MNLSVHDLHLIIKEESRTLFSFYSDCVITLCIYHYYYIQGVVNWNGFRICFVISLVLTLFTCFLDIFVYFRDALWSKYRVYFIPTFFIAFILIFPSLHFLCHSQYVSLFIFPHICRLLGFMGNSGIKTTGFLTAHTDI